MSDRARWEQIQDLFERALERPPGDRALFLHEACEGDTALLAEVSALLAAHDRGGDFESLPTEWLNSLDAAQAASRAIGPYRVLRELASGGMGQVFLAEQRKPVQRTVALKLIRPGMDSKEIVARFEAERQALALLNHPNIAQVFDGGTAQDGRPYFAMEFIPDIPITEHAEQQGLDVGLRLELFLSVCEAVQHAHQKGLIHRDLKPSNILVTLQDGRPVPKIIDFGIAKATASR